MKYPSPAYRKLKKTLTGIRGVLRGVPEAGNNTNLQHLKVQSYILLAHSAIEQYLEELAESTLNDCVEKFNTHKQVNQCIVSLIAFETIAQLDDNDSRKKIQSNVVKQLEAFVNIAKKHHLHAIRSNNGIKHKDQRALLLPVGIDPMDVDAVTAAALDAFGTKRGGVAHQVKIQTSETRSSVLTETRTLLFGLENYDREACRIVSSGLT